METGLRHNGRLTSNYLLLMALGGVIAALGFVSKVHEQIIAFVAASIIAPGLEPLAKLPLGVLLRRADVAWVGLKASLVGYAVLALAASLVFLLVLQLGSVNSATFLEHEALASLLQIELKDVLLSAAAATASIIMYLAYRRNVIAGPLIALILIPAASALGMSVAIGEWGHARQLAQRLGVDIALVVGAGLILIYGKQTLVHRREPLR